MKHQGLVLQRAFFCFSVLFMITSMLVESTTPAEQVSDSKFEAAQDRTNALATSSIQGTSEVLKPSQIRNRRSNLLTEKEQFIDDDNPGLDSAYMYSDQIMQNLLKTQSPKPLNYARSNFFLNLLKPRTTRYNAWDDHSLMHFGKRSPYDFNDADRILVKRSADVWSPNNVLHFGKKSENSVKNDGEAFQAGIEIPNSEAGEQITSDEIDLSSNDDPDSIDETVNKKSIDPWHSKMSFGKKSETSLDDSILYTDKKDDPWHNKMSFGKRFENPWDHNTMHFGKKDDPWHNMMSFGKKSDPWHSMMSFGKKSDPWHSMMSFGKRVVNPWDHNTLHFGKRDEPWHNMMSFGKKSDPWHSMMSFGKKSDPWHSKMSFGKKSDPWHSMMSFGKKSDNPWDHNTLHFGKREDPWHNMMSFGKRSENYDMTDLDKRDDPWHNMMSFGKRYDDLENNSTTVTANKRDEPWHNMMSFGKRSDNGFGEHFTLHFGKRDEPWHSMMSFGKKSDMAFDHNTLHFGKREDPWHNMMSFGKKSDGLWDHNTLHFGKKDEPWHNMMSFGKKSDNPWGEHNTLHFGKRQDPWHNMMSFGKRSGGLAEDDFIEDFVHNSNPWEDYNAMEFNKKYDPWEHNALHFGKKSNVSLGSILSTPSVENVNLKHIQKRSADMWNDHHTMHFGKKSDPWESHNTMHFGKKSDPWETHNTMHFGKKAEPWESHNTMHFGKKSELEDFENSMNVDKRFDWEHNNLHFGKKSEPWEHHNTMHFGKKSDPWDYHNTMHFGKRNPWEYQNTMHFGKKSDPWDYHNTMHFGKKSDPWDYHNTMHFGKRSGPNLETDDTHSQNNIEMKKDKENKEPNLNKNYNSNEALESDTTDNESKVDAKKRSSKTLKSTSDSVKYNINDDSNKEISNNEVKELNDNQKFADQSRIIKRSLKNAESINEKNAMIGNAKQKFGNGLTVVTNKEHVFEPSTSALSDQKDHKLNESQENNTKSRIYKRSIESAFNTHNEKHSENLDPNAETFEEYSKDDFPETVLHFGKRSTEDSEDNRNKFEAPWFDPSEAKRFDDFWDNHNTLHFGKKSEPWGSHSTLHFGKKSNPWEHQSTMHFGKRDPWEYHNTLHFGKKFDPWEGHAKMHFGKRTGDWDHNVMHFGKRDELKTDDDENTDEDVLALLLDPIKLKHLLQGIEGIDIEENNDLLEDLKSLEMIVRSYLKDENMPIEEKLLLLKSYLKPILKTVFSRQIPEDKLLPYSRNALDGEVYNNEITDDRKESLDSLEEFPARIVTNDFNYEGVLPAESEDSDGREYDGHLKLIDYLKEYKDFFKSKRSYLGKPEFKRYFVPFQGPRSIVYPHAWFASQIRRSAIPRTPEYARTMEMRMAEKKEDPFNSYMHFGRR